MINIPIDKETSRKIAEACRIACEAIQELSKSLNSVEKQSKQRSVNPVNYSLLNYGSLQKFTKYGKFNNKWT
jgi:hypothetical protein